MVKRIICFLFVFLMIFASVVTVSAAEDGGIASVEQMLAKTKAKTFDGDYMRLNYRRYDSPAYKPGDGAVKATLIVFFHEAGGEGDDNKAQLQAGSVLSQLLSAQAEKECADYRYIVIAPQCPTGENWTSATGTDYKFSPNATRVMSTVKALVDDIKATDAIFEDRVAVIGMGNGATAAYDFFCRYSSTVSRVMSVGGFCDASAVATNERAKDKAFRVVAPKGDKVVYANTRALKAKLDSLNVPVNVEYHEYDGDTKAALKGALAFNEPSIVQWAVTENFSSEGFTLSCVAGEGGKVSPTSAKIGYNGSAMINITQEQGFKIQSVKVNNKEISVSSLKKTQNPNIFSYTITNIKADTFVDIKFTTDMTDSAKYDLVINRTIKWCIGLAIAFLFVAAIIFGVFWYEKSLRYEKSGK
ncbi:MAG: hypothetical protein IJB65_01215 [Clostridia bacterium]|nr:hypothetical protein [Clostridia bacterium]